MKLSILTILGLMAFILSAFTAPRATGRSDRPDEFNGEITKPAVTDGDETAVFTPVNKEEEAIGVDHAVEDDPCPELAPAGPGDAGFAVADKALEDGAIDDLAADMTAAIVEGLRTRFSEVLKTKELAGDSTEAGRAFVTAYLEYAHYVEALHAMASRGPQGHHHVHSGGAGQLASGPD
jgi:hypothetical protein